MKLKGFGQFIIVLIIVLLALGFALGPANNFISNLLAGLVGTLSSIFIVIFIANKYISEINDQLREQQWSKVRKSTYESIIDDLFIVLFSVYTKLPISGLSYYDPYDPTEIKNYNKKILEELPSEFKAFSDLIPQIIRSPHHEIDIETGSGMGLVVAERDVNRIVETTYEDIKPVLDGIRYVKIPRIRQSSTDQEIIDALIRFEGFIDAYNYNVRRFKKDSGVGRGESTIKSMGILINNALELHSQIKAKINP